MKTWISSETNVLFRGQIVVYLYHDREDKELREELVANEFALRNVISKCEGVLDYTVAFRRCTKTSPLFLDEKGGRFHQILDEHYMEYRWWRCY